MDFLSEPRRCPGCHALVVDRRSATCTTCRAALPADWVMTKEQTARMMAIDRASRAQHTSEMRLLDPQSDPNVPALVKFLDQNGSRFI